METSDNCSSCEDVAALSAGQVIAYHAGAGVGLAMMRLNSLKNYKGIYKVKPAEGRSTEMVSVVPFRPDWWPDTDPLTGEPIIQ